MSTFLGIEIGGTKLQLGVGAARDAELIELLRSDVVVSEGAAGIVRQIEQLVTALLGRHSIASIGIGFGGPVDVRSGCVTKSHQIAGWDGMPLVARLEDQFGRPVAIDNDCNVAALAEANLGAGRRARRVFYVTVGTGIGGGFVVDGRLQGSQRPAIAEIGHLRPGTLAVDPRDTVESLASGWGIARSIREEIQTHPADKSARELLARCNDNLDLLTAKHAAEAAEQGNSIARRALEKATQVLGWAIAQTVTLLAPEAIVVGGGVSLIGELFFEPLRRQTQHYVFPPLRDSFQIVPAELGEEVVVHGALLLARSSSKATSSAVES